MPINFKINNSYDCKQSDTLSHKTDDPNQRESAISVIVQVFAGFQASHHQKKGPNCNLKSSFENDSPTGSPKAVRTECTKPRLPQL